MNSRDNTIKRQMLGYIKFLGEKGYTFRTDEFAFTRYVAIRGRLILQDLAAQLASADIRIDTEE